MHQDSLNNHRRSHGTLLIEVALGVAILSIVVVMVTLVMTLFLDARDVVLTKTKALYLAEEGIEVMRYMRDADWNILSTELSTGTTYYFLLNPTVVATTTVPEVIDGSFYREFELRDVYRNSVSDDIDISGGGGTYIDDSIVEVEVRVGYGGSTTTLRTLLGNIFNQ